MHDLQKIMLFLVMGVLHIPCILSQQVVKIQGRVVDENEKPLPYVNIFLTNSKTGTVTNNNCAFSVSFSGKEPRYVFGVVDEYWYGDLCFTIWIFDISY